MVVHDVSDKTPSTLLLVARLHVDLCRLKSAMCTARAPFVRARTA
ncbi:putative leader peptide [Streptomyces genisteinicus]